MEQNLPWETNSHSASQEIPYLFGTRRFITVFTTARHLSLSWGRWIQYTPSHHISLRAIPILGFHLHLSLPSVLFHSLLKLSRRLWFKSRSS